MVYNVNESDGRYLNKGVLIMNKKDIAEDFLVSTAKGDVRRVYESYVADDFFHHNPWFRGDRETIMLAMEDAAKEQPDVIFEVKLALEDGDYVSTHSHFRLNEDHIGMASTHIFRFRDDKIVEMWDYGQEIPENMVNENGMF